MEDTICSVHKKNKIPGHFSVFRIKNMYKYILLTIMILAYYEELISKRALCIEKSLIFSKVGQTNESNFIAVVLFINGEKIKKFRRRLDANHMYL